MLLHCFFTKFFKTLFAGGLRRPRHPCARLGRVRCTASGMRLLVVFRLMCRTPSHSAAFYDGRAIRIATRSCHHGGRNSPKPPRTCGPPASVQLLLCLKPSIIAPSRHLGELHPLSLPGACAGCGVWPVVCGWRWWFGSCVALRHSPEHTFERIAKSAVTYCFSGG